MPQILRFLVDGQDCVVDVRPDNTLFELMDIVCREWLNDARDGDGEVYDHLWKIVTPANTLHIGPYGGGMSFDERGEYAAESCEEPENSTKLGSLSLQPGATLCVEYDFGSTTYFNIILNSIETVSDEAARSCPCKFEQEGTALTPYVPPEGTPNLNELFPHANKLLFDSIAKWILMFPMNEECVGVVEAGPNAMGDMVYCPCKFGSVGEFLAALDLAGQCNPNKWTRQDAFSRMVFPLKMDPEDETKYQLFKTDLDRFNRLCKEKGIKDGPMSLDQMIRAGLSDEDVYRMCGPEETVVRVTEPDLSKLGEFDFAKAFPKTSAAHDSNEYLWISYRRGKMQICSGVDTERGIPRPGGVLAESKKEITSLHDFFCVAEALWASAE